MKEESRNNRLVLISLFLTLEIMLFIAFDFGGIGPIFKGIAFVLMLILLPHFWKGMQDDLMKGLYILLMPLVFYLFITLLAPAYGTMDVVYNNETFMNFSLFTKLINLVGITAVLILGYMVNKSGLFSAKSVYIVVLAGLAAPIFISFLATLINYGPFHTIIYAGKVIFYNGDVYLVATQASYLVGFNIIPANINVLINGAIILSSVGFGLLFLKGKQEKYETITLAVVSAIGLLTIVMLGAFRQLFYLIPAALFVVVMKFGLMKYLKNKVTIGILLGVVGLGAIVFILTAFNVFNLQTIWQSNPITRRLLLNGYMTKFYFIFKEAFSFRNIYGDFRNSIGTTDIFPTGNFLFDSLWIDGLLGFLGLAVFLTLFVINLVRYFASSRDTQLLKVSLVTLLLTMFFRFMLKYPFHRFIYEEHLSFDFWPLINSPFFLITVFFAGYVFTASQSDGGKIDEKK